MCPVCGREEEDGAHLFFECKLARNVWQLLSLGDRVVLANFPTPAEVLAYILDAKEENRPLMVILIWFLWSERNNVREEGRRSSADTLARSIKLYVRYLKRKRMEKGEQKQLKKSGANHRKGC